MADNRDRQQSQLVGYQQAQNQLLAIQAQQKQNLAAAKADNNQSAARAQVARQAAGLLTANQQAAVNANLNPQTRGILKKYGLEKPQISHSQQRVGQNVIINNNTTNNYGGPVQGRALNFSDPQIAMKKQQEESGRFKAWLNGLFAKQSEEDAARNRAYEKRERELEKSSRSVTKKMGEIGKNIMTGLSPKRIMSSMNDGLKRILMIFGMHLVAANWNKIITKVADIENKVKESLEYFGIIKSKEPSSSKNSFMYDFRYILGGEEAAREGKSIIQLFKKILIGEKDGEDDPKSLWGHIKLYFSHKAEERSEALRQLPPPVLDKDALNNIPGLLTTLAGYLSNVLSIVVSGSEGLKKGIGQNINAKAAQSSKAYQERFRLDYKQDVLDEDSDITISHTAKDWKGNTVDLTKVDNVKGGIDAATMAIAKGNYMGQHGSNVDKFTGDIKNTTDATLGQGAELARQLSEAGQGKISTAGVTRSLSQLYNVSSDSSVKDGVGTVLPSYLLDTALGSRRDEILEKAGAENLTTATYKYVAVPKDEWDKVEDGESAAWEFANKYMANSVGGAALPLGKLWEELDFADVGFYLLGKSVQVASKYGLEHYKTEFVAKAGEGAFKKAMNKLIAKFGKRKAKILFVKYATRIMVKAAASVASGFATAGVGWVIGTGLIVWDIVELAWEVFKMTSAGAAASAALKDYRNPSNYRLKLVPSTYQCKEGEFDTGQTEKVYVSNKAGIKALSDIITGSDTASKHKFSISNRDVLSSVDNALKGIAKSAGAKVDYEDMDIKTAFSSYDKLQALEQEHDEVRSKYSTYLGESSDRFLNETSAGRSMQSLYRGVTGNFSSQNLSYRSTGDGGQSRFHIHRNSRKHALNVRAATEYAQKNMMNAAYYQNHINPRKRGWDKETGTGACAAGVREILSKGGGLVNGVDFRGGDANTWFDSLTEFGWYNLGPNIDAAEPGDVVATDPNFTDDSGKKHMHVQFLGDDGKWYSDFAQSSWYPYKRKSFMAEFKAGAFVFRWPNKIGGSYSYLEEGTDTSSGLYLEDKSTIDNYERHQAEDFTAKFFGTSLSDVVDGIKDFGAKTFEATWNGMEGTVFENTNKYGVTPLSEGDLITPELCGYEKYLNACKEGTLRYLPPGLTLENYMAKVKAMTGKNPGELLQGGVFSGSSSSVSPKATKTSRNGFISTPFTTGGVTYNNPTEALASKIGQSVQSNADIQNSGTVAIIEQLSNLNQTMKGVELNTGMQINNSKGSTPPITSAQRELTTGASS